LTQRPNYPSDDSADQAAAQIAKAVTELTRAMIVQSGLPDARGELAATRLTIEETAKRLQDHLDEARDRQNLLGQQLGGLATSLDRLVAHLEGLSRLMGDLLERVAEQTPAVAAAPAPPPEASFPAGGEGTTLVLASVPGFQGLMDIQKALTALEPIAGASVERYQEGDSRILLHLRSQVTANQIAEAIRAATGQVAVVEESRPELLRLKVKIIPNSA
jgi:hypothetical protein